MDIAKILQYMHVWMILKRRKRFQTNIFILQGVLFMQLILFETD